jgi:hypothetical protein
MSAALKACQQRQVLRESNCRSNLLSKQDVERFTRDRTVKDEFKKKNCLPELGPLARARSTLLFALSRLCFDAQRHKLQVLSLLALLVHKYARTQHAPLRALSPVFWQRGARRPRGRRLCGVGHRSHAPTPAPVLRPVISYADVC